METGYLSQGRRNGLRAIGIRLQGNAITSPNIQMAVEERHSILFVTEPGFNHLSWVLLIGFHIDTIRQLRASEIQFQASLLLSSHFLFCCLFPFLLALRNSRSRHCENAKNVGRQWRDELIEMAQEIPCNIHVCFPEALMRWKNLTLNAGWLTIGPNEYYYYSRTSKLAIERYKDQQAGNFQKQWFKVFTIWHRLVTSVTFFLICI